MSGNSPVEDPPEGVSFPEIGQYETIATPGEPGYVEPEPEPVADLEPDAGEDDGIADDDGDDGDLADDAGDDTEE